MHRCCPSVRLSVCLFASLSPKCKKTRFSQKLSNLELLTTYRKSAPCDSCLKVRSIWIHLLTYLFTWAFQRTHYWTPEISKMAEIRHLENRHDVIFYAEGGPIWIKKNSQTGAEWHVDCGDMVKTETRCRIPIWRTFGRIQRHVIPKPRITLHCAATWWIHCHDPRATCHIAGCSHLAKSMSWSCHTAGCNTSIRHMENRFRHYFILFFNAVWALTSGGFVYRLRYTCL